MIDQSLIDNFPSVGRFSGSTLLQAESVPDHSVQMALLCINFSELCPESDRRDMCYRCIIHDFEESITSDVVRPLKHYNEEVKTAIDNAGKHLLKEATDEEFCEEVFSAKDIENVNGFLVHIADKLQCFMKIRREVELLGNRTLKRDFEVFKSTVYQLVSEVANYQNISKDSRDKLSIYINNLIINY